ncbi:MAG: hypothetical protein IMZ57_11060 [Acidobacteria bacterium]|nr:hypothetical protein [Acidobacteriota bacterium]
MEHNGREEKNPWSKWYWADWLADPAVRVSSLAAQGLWINVLALLATSKIRGILLIPEKQNSPIFGKDVDFGKQKKSKIEAKYLSKIVSEKPETVEILLSELETNGVFSRDNQGRIYNRRMIREKEISEIRSEAGRRGGRPKTKQTVSKLSKRKASSASAYAYASNSSSLKEGRSGGEASESPLISIPELGEIIKKGQAAVQVPLDKIPPCFVNDARKEIPRIFEEGGHSDLLKDPVFSDYLVALAWEFKDVETEDTIKGKFAHWIKVPLTKKSNICLQFRNWFRNERRFEAERAKERLVGKYKPEK